jgi:tetratricopeptide (TPR) repeat protein
MEAPKAMEMDVEEAAEAQAEEPLELQEEASELEWPDQEVPEAEPEPMAVMDMEAVETAPAMSLEGAREALSGGNLTGALQSYSQLISQEENLDEVISDLQKALEYDHPVDIDVWQTLGDAYARSDQLQDALDAYTQAEELLR